MKSRQPFLLTIILSSVSLLFLTQCKKGDTGPEGPKGTANVIYSDWIATTPWTASTTSTGAGKSTFYLDLTSSAVTQAIIDSGTVLVYAKFISDPDGTGIAKALPSTYYNLGGAATQYNFQYGLFLKKIRVICDVVPAGTPATTNQVRYIIIPGGVNVTTLSTNSTGGSSSPYDYKTICARYNIPE
ncbi:MAG: hypothetical protein J7578_14355 [Chitinophagaceae bacterium]|nr:hypothetical protein [Chitinophagaceae bacterium]